MKILITNVLMVLLLIFSSDLFADSKGNRDAYHTYFSGRYNKMIQTQNILKDIMLYSSGHMDRITYMPNVRPFPEQEALKGAKLREKYRPLTIKLGEQMDKLNNIINSAFSKWTDQHTQEMKALVGEVNILWKNFGEEMKKTFPPGSPMLKEREIESYMKAYSEWKVKSVADIDKEN